MMAAGLGIDIVDIPRFEKACKEHGDRFLERIFTKKELDHGSDKRTFYAHMAGKFAAKEAVKKALPDGARIGLAWNDIEILNDEDGKPYTVLHGEARKLMEENDLSQVLVSISHTDTAAVSNGMAVKNGE